MLASLKKMRDALERDKERAAAQAPAPASDKGKGTFKTNLKQISGIAPKPVPAPAPATPTDPRAKHDVFGGKFLQAKQPTAAEREAAAKAAEQRAQVDATNARYGTDLSWLDPTFQESPATLGQSSGSLAQADPNVITAQADTFKRLSDSANAPWKWGSDAAQRATQEQMAARAGGTGAPVFAGEGDQRAQLGNLQEIIAGGGANTLERAARQRQRADQEQWLRGQREADMQDYAERGLSGSGAELLALSTDRQGAAGRNSLADLDTAASLERRRDEAINSAAGLAGQMRSADQSEKQYLDQAKLQAMGMAGEQANTMRGQTAQEQTAERDAQQNALAQAGQMANTARSQSAQEGQFRAQSADDFAKLNQQAINNASSANKQFMQNAYQNMMANRQVWEQNKLNLGVSTAQNLQNFDQRENTAGYNQASGIGAQNADASNSAAAQYRGGAVGTNDVGSQNVLSAQQQMNQFYQQFPQLMGTVADTWMSSGLNAGGTGTLAAAPAVGGTKQGLTQTPGATKTQTSAGADDEMWKRLQQQSRKVG